MKYNLNNWQLEVHKFVYKNFNLDEIYFYNLFACKKWLYFAYCTKKLNHKWTNRHYQLRKQQSILNINYFNFAIQRALKVYVRWTKGIFLFEYFTF